MCRCSFTCSLYSFVFSLIHFCSANLVYIAITVLYSVNICLVVAGSTLLVLTCVDLQAPKDIFVLRLPPGGTPYLRLYMIVVLSIL